MNDGRPRQHLSARSDRTGALAPNHPMSRRPSARRSSTNGSGSACDMPSSHRGHGPRRWRSRSATATRWRSTWSTTSGLRRSPRSGSASSSDRVYPATPALLLCTSGTAAANFYPAVVEAGLSEVPMIVLTADRPEELRGVGAPQTIDQIELYGGHVRWFHDPGVPDAAGAAEWRQLAATTWAHAATGPVQLNLPFREPLVGTPCALPAPFEPDDPSRSSGPSSLRPISVPERFDTERGVILVGGRHGVDEGKILELHGRTAWPIIADPTSGLRHLSTVTTIDALLRDESLSPPTGSPTPSCGSVARPRRRCSGSGRLGRRSPSSRWADPVGSTRRTTSRPSVRSTTCSPSSPDRCDRIDLAAGLACGRRARGARAGRPVRIGGRTVGAGCRSDAGRAPPAGSATHRVVVDAGARPRMVRWTRGPRPQQPGSQRHRRRDLDGAGAVARMCTAPLTLRDSC